MNFLTNQSAKNALTFLCFFYIIIIILFTYFLFIDYRTFKKQKLTQSALETDTFKL